VRAQLSVENTLQQVGRLIDNTLATLTDTLDQATDGVDLNRKKRQAPTDDEDDFLSTSFRK